MNPPPRNANSVFRRKGERKPIDVRGGVPSRTNGAEGHPVCTSEALQARKIGEGPYRSPGLILDGPGVLPHWDCVIIIVESGVGRLVNVGLPKTA